MKKSPSPFTWKTNEPMPDVDCIQKERNQDEVIKAFQNGWVLLGVLYTRTSAGDGIGFTDSAEYIIGHRRPTAP